MNGRPVAALVAVNALSLYVENTDPRFAERALVDWLKLNPGATVRVDPDMARRSDLLLSFAGLDGRAVGGLLRAVIPFAGISA